MEIKYSLTAKIILDEFQPICHVEKDRNKLSGQTQLGYDISVSYLKQELLFKCHQGKHSVNCRFKIVSIGKWHS